ncbi:Fe-Mn family superoxide dismutase [Buchnera aphidicola (Taiwanaphis decaspermi)]|uniref:Fe-Mn family superoxide dismutase n=1 Tax=Buchnera aphidicola TaxID=9 RepID=UPI0031B894F6
MYTLPKMKYSYDYFEPYFDTLTMKIHHTKHHQNYVNNLNNALLNTKISKSSLKHLLQNLHKISKDKLNVIRNNAGGHFNHTFFWKILKKNCKLSGELKKQIIKTFGNVDNFKKCFENKAIEHFGSGWIWLVKNDNNLSIINTNNQDNPIMSKEITGVFGNPIIALDLWEHSYYLKYKNNRLDYVKSFWKLLNWEKANCIYLKY